MLATWQTDQPYTSLMAFAHTQDLRQLVFATLRATQKHTDLARNASVAMLIDNRRNDAADYQHAIAISVFGRAHEIDAAALPALQALYLQKHPKLKDFVESPACVLLKIAVSSYRVVSEFQAVEVLTIA